MSEGNLKEMCFFQKAKEAAEVRMAWSSWPGSTEMAAGKEWIPQSTPLGCKCFSTPWLVAASSGLQLGVRMGTGNTDATKYKPWAVPKASRTWDDPASESDRGASRWFLQREHHCICLFCFDISSLECHYKVITENEVGKVWCRAHGRTREVIQRCLMCCPECRSS